MAPAPKEVVVTGVRIPFLAAVWLIFKWSLASIPAMFLLWVVGLVFTGIAGVMATAVLTALGLAAGATAI